MQILIKILSNKLAIENNFLMIIQYSIELLSLLLKTLDNCQQLFIVNFTIIFKKIEFLQKDIMEYSRSFFSNRESTLLQRW